MARELCAHHIEVSARTGFNIPQAFEVSFDWNRISRFIVDLAFIPDNARK